MVRLHDGGTPGITARRTRIEKTTRTSHKIKKPRSQGSRGFVHKTNF